MIMTPNVRCEILCWELLFVAKNFQSIREGNEYGLRKNLCDQIINEKFEFIQGDVKDYNTCF